MAVKGPLSFGSLRTLDVWPDLGYNRRAKGHVGYEMAVHLEHWSQLPMRNTLHSHEVGRQNLRYRYEAMLPLVQWYQNRQRLKLRNLRKGLRAR